MIRGDLGPCPLARTKHLLPRLHLALDGEDMSFLNILSPQMIQDDFGCSQALVAASVAIYMVMVGVAALVWGPASDRFGRKVRFALGA